MARLVVARVEEDRKVLDDLPTLVAESRRGKAGGRSGPARDGPSISQVCFKCGSTDHWARDCPKMDDGSSNPKKRNLGAHVSGAWTCCTADNFRGAKCLNFPCGASNHLEDLMCVDFLCGGAISPVQDDDECGFMLLI